MSDERRAAPSPSANLFDRWDLDPSSGPQTITERLRDRMEDADPAAAVELRRAWEELTMHPKRRIAEALTTFPETRPPVGRPPLPLRPTAIPTLGEEARVAHAPVAAPLAPLGPGPVSVLPPPAHDPLLHPRATRPSHGGPK